MKLERIFLQNYANYESQDYATDRMLNVLVGENAQGKTNLLDAIYYLSRGSSGRYGRDADIIRWGNGFFRLRALVRSHEMTRDITISYTQGKKAVSVDGNALRSNAQLMGVFNTVLFSPDDLAMVKGSPERRRKYLDDELMQTDPTYYGDVYRYRKILQQRNNVLKKIRAGQKEEHLLDVLDEQLAGVGMSLTRRRMDMAERIRPLARLVQRRMTAGEEELDIEYLCSSRRQPRNKGETICEETFLELLKESRAEDVGRGFTGYGPHRDDLMTLINGADARISGSQGQQRTVALSLKIAEIEFLKAQTGEVPVLLLDDVLSELDGGRRKKLLETVSDNIQTFITCTELEHLDPQLIGRAAVSRIRQGKVE